MRRCIEHRIRASRPFECYRRSQSYGPTMSTLALHTVVFYRGASWNPSISVSVVNKIGAAQ